MGPVARGSVAKRARGYARPMFGRWRKKQEEHRADKQQGDPGALELEGDPRGGLQDSSYRTAEATEVVEAEGVAMSGPGGAPQEATSPDKRREQDR